MVTISDDGSNGESGTNVDCYVGVGGPDSNSDSLVDCCGLVAEVNCKTRSIGWLLLGGGGGLGEEVARKNYISVETFKKRRIINPGGELKGNQGEQSVMM